jgi:hypothetical protein
MEERLLEIVENHLLKILAFNPYANFEGVNSTEDFMRVIEKDPAFAPFSLNREKYVTARFGGKLVTSLHRKLGDLYEELILVLLSKKFGLTKIYLKYALQLQIDQESQTRTTDGRIMLADVPNTELQNIVRSCLSDNYKGLALEVRSCYQIGDSKRIQADVHMALALKTLNIEPIMLIFCATSLESPVRRLSKIWTLHEGNQAFGFVKQLTEFDLFAFLMQNKERFRIIIDQIFDKF